MKIRSRAGGQFQVLDLTVTEPLARAVVEAALGARSKRRAVGATQVASLRARVRLLPVLPACAVAPGAAAVIH